MSADALEVRGFPDAIVPRCCMLMGMDENDYHRLWAKSIPSKFSATRHHGSEKLVATTSVPIADLERLKALAASQDQSVSALFWVLISAFLDGERAASGIAASEPIRGRRATVSTAISVEDHARLLAIAKKDWVSIGALLRHLIQEALKAETP